MAAPGRITRLLAGWESLDGPLGQRLALAVTDLVEQGDLRDGEKMPSERALGAALMVSRGTVTEAYNLLRASGVLESRVGSGSVITFAAGRGLGGPRAEARLSSFGEPSSQRQHDLSSGAPGGLPLVAEHSERVLRDSRFSDLVAGAGYEPAGLPELRSALADYYGGRGVPTGADELLITSGSQQALTMIAGALISPGDVVLVEDPSYRGALDAFRAYGARLVPVPVDSAGPDLEVLGRLVRQLKPRLFYSLPISHNPTGYVVTPERAPEWSWSRPGGGSGLWARVPGLDAVAFGQHARRHGILVSPGPIFSAVEGFSDHLRIPFWREPDALSEGLVHLVALWRAYQDTAARPSTGDATYPISARLGGP